MSTDPNTRDGRISKEIISAQEIVDRLQTTMRSLVAQAHSQDAKGHEGLYEAVEVEIDRAWKALGLAHDLMAYGNPEDYA